MAQKETIAIIGATTEVGVHVAKSIAANFRLLLMDNKPSELDLLQAKIQQANKAAEADVLHCCKNASWEADMIVVAHDGENLNQIAATMKEVSNCKTILHFTSNQNDLDRLQQLLPNADVVTILCSKPFTNVTTDAFVRGRDEGALDTAKTILAAMAWQTQIHQGV